MRHEEEVTAEEPFRLYFFKQTLVSTSGQKRGKRWTFFLGYLIFSWRSLFLEDRAGDITMTTRVVNSLLFVKNDLNFKLEQD